MPINLDLNNMPFELSEGFLALLNREIEQLASLSGGENEIVFSFRDIHYSAETGGYHPVEIRWVKEQGFWCFDYITDFSFVGSGHDAELTKEIDFDFTQGSGFHLYTGEHALRSLDDLFEIWQANFVDYYHSGVFQTKVSAS